MNTFVEHKSDQKRRVEVNSKQFKSSCHSYGANVILSRWIVQRVTSHVTTDPESWTKHFRRGISDLFIGRNSINEVQDLLNLLGLITFFSFQEKKASRPWRRRGKVSSSSSSLRVKLSLYFEHLKRLAWVHKNN